MALLDILNIIGLNKSPDFAGAVMFKKNLHFPGSPFPVMCGKNAFGGQCASRYEYRSCNNMVGPLHQNQHCTASAGFVNIHWCFIHYPGTSPGGGARMPPCSHSLSAKPQVCCLSSLFDNFMQDFRLQSQVQDTRCCSLPIKYLAWTYFRFKCWVVLLFSALCKKFCVLGDFFQSWPAFTFLLQMVSTLEPTPPWSQSCHANLPWKMRLFAQLPVSYHIIITSLSLLLCLRNTIVYDSIRLFHHKWPRKPCDV